MTNFQYHVCLYSSSRVHVVSDVDVFKCVCVCVCLCVFVFWTYTCTRFCAPLSRGRALISHVKLSYYFSISIFDNQIFTHKNQIWSLCNRKYTFCNQICTHKYQFFTHKNQIWSLCNRKYTFCNQIFTHKNQIHTFRTKFILIEPNLYPLNQICAHRRTTPQYSSLCYLSSAPTPLSFQVVWTQRPEERKGSTIG